MTLPILTLSVILGLMIAESRVSREHERALRRQGAVEPPGDIYRIMAVAYPLSFVVMGVEGVVMPQTWPGLYPSGLLLFAAGKALKYWAISALGPRWTFRVLVLPGVPLVRTGPYRYVAHPNYVGVVGELAGTAMMMGAWRSGPVALVVFGAILWARIRCENRALHSSREA